MSVSSSSGSRRMRPATRRSRRPRVRTSRRAQPACDRRARPLADAGHEVIYTGLHQTPEMIAAAAVQESVDAVGLSIMSGAHMTLFPAVLAALTAAGADDVLIFGGGIIPREDGEELKRLGV